VKEVHGVNQGSGVVLDAAPRIETMKRKARSRMTAKRLPDVEISEPLPLKEFDESGETWVQFQRPRRWEREQISQMRAKAILEFDTADQGTVRQRDVIPEDVLDGRRVCVCLVDSSLLDAQGKPVFVPGKTCRAARKMLTNDVEDGFNAQWAELPDNVAQEISRLLAE